MIAQIKAELLKVRSTRTTLGLLLGMIALILLFELLTGLLSNVGALSSTEDQRQLLSIGSLAGVFSALAGALLVTSEYRYGTIRPTILFTPYRSRVLAAKVIAGALAGIAFGIVGEALGWALGYVAPQRSRDHLRAQRRPSHAAGARRPRRDRALGRDRRRTRRDRPQPGRRRHRAARLGLRRRPPAVRAPPVRRALHADLRSEWPDRPDHSASPRARGGRHRARRLGGPARGHRRCPDREA